MKSTEVIKRMLAVFISERESILANTNTYPSIEETIIDHGKRLNTLKNKIDVLEWVLS